MGKKSKQKALPPETLKRLLRYEPETGKLFWLHRPRDLCSSDASFRSWNSARSGREAFLTVKDGYLRGMIFETRYSAHRVAWAIHYGKWPDGEIDHINGIRNDNRIENLRDVSCLTNRRNTAKQVKNTNAITGVRRCDVRGGYLARIGVGGRDKYLGRFRCLTAAIVARKAAEIQHGYTERHGT